MLKYLRYITVNEIDINGKEKDAIFIKMYANVDYDLSFRKNT